MQDRLIELGAKVIDSNTFDYEGANLSIKIIFVSFIVVAFCYMFKKLIEGNYASAITPLTFVIILSFMCMFFQSNADKETHYRYTILINDSTKLTNITEEFEVIKWDSYPILVVEAKS